jgi:hypothetical protein
VGSVDGSRRPGGAGHDGRGAVRAPRPVTAPVVDLGLPTDRELSASAAPDPIREADRLTGAGNPVRIGELARTFTETGIELDDVYRQSQSAQQRLAAGLRNDRDPVYDEATHRAALPPGFRDAGSQLHALGRRLGAVSAELHAAIGDVNRSVAQLQADLTGRRRAWQAELGALGGPSGQLPTEAIAGLLARRAAVAAGMQEAVSSCGRSVVERIDRYNDVLRSCRQLLDEFHFPTDSSGIRLNGIVAPSGVAAEPRPDTAPLTTTGAGGPQVEIHPLPDGRFEGRTDHPPAPVGRSVDLAVPAPPPDARTDGEQLPSNGPRASTSTSTWIRLPQRGPKNPRQGRRRRRRARLPKAERSGAISRALPMQTRL